MRAGTIEIADGTLETGWWGPGPAEAPTLVLLHEGLGSVTLWRDVPRRLAASTGWGVFAYSRFGYGNSDTTPLPRPMSYMHHEALSVLPQVLRAAGIKQAALIGHSDGGSIAAIYAGSTPTSSQPLSPATLSSAPESSPKLSCPGLVRPPTTLLNAAPQPATPPGHIATTTPTLFGIVTIAAHFIVEDLNIASIQHIKAEYETGTLRQRLSRYHRNVDTAFRGWNDAWLDPRFRDFDITALLPNIQVPILALQGDNDPYGTDAQLLVLQANAQAPVTIQLITGAKHSPHLEAADTTLAAIASFIANLPQGPST